LRGWCATAADAGRLGVPATGLVRAGHRAIRTIAPAVLGLLLVYRLPWTITGLALNRPGSRCLHER